MPIFESRIDPKTPTFAENRERMLGRVLEIKNLEQKVRDASAASADKFRARGQLLPRERIEPRDPIVGDLRPSRAHDRMAAEALQRERRLRLGAGLR